jgi:CheY-like chemotaxis protein
MNELSNTILLVEDNEDDVFAFQRALKKARVANPVQIAVDGQQAVDFLAGTGEFTDRARYPLPFLVFLDLKLPYRDGFEVLAWIKEQPHLRPVSVVILTGSDETRDHQKAYLLGARSYLVKPPSAEEIAQLLESMRSSWSRFGENGPVITHAG